MKESRGITPLRTILRNCLNHIENLETNRSICDNYDKEFQDLKQFSETLKVQKEFSCTEGEKEVNRKKNRYKDILPFNVSRVVLSEYAGVPGSDYINANFIKGASGSPAYIASQGPLPNTVNDFWRMVVECEVQVIVMACNAQESGKHKCENYWVEKEGEEKRFGMVQICLVKASIVCPDFLVRTMRLKYTNDKDITEERTVCQFHYSAWPDHGVPPLVRPLLDMVRLVRDTQASETLPVLVHCSAGCGRTGTICAIDFVWGLLRAGKLTEEFSLFNLVRDMRKQRVAMVQTKEQYILVHQAVRELFKEQLRVIESHPYENIDFNGVPLIKDCEEPFYDTISIRKVENCDEKQDKSEVKEKKDDGEGRANKADSAPPLPRKKRPNVLFSKQEKEAENLTEKNRSSSSCDKDRDQKGDASLGGLLGKPRIVKLRALFEKNPTAKDRSGLKDRGSQTVSRSHSLGAFRKPLTSDVFEAQKEKGKGSGAGSGGLGAPPQPPTAHPDAVKLKHSKSFSKSVPLIKRSKSLKTFSPSPHLSVVPGPVADRKSVELTQPVKLQESRDLLNGSDQRLWKPVEPVVRPVPGPVPDSSKRRRSLESLMGDVPPPITWPNVVTDVTRASSGPNKSGSDWKTADLIRQQLQRLSLETEMRLSNCPSGIGTRERRNSFRQAVTKSDFHNAFRPVGEPPPPPPPSSSASSFSDKSSSGTDYGTPSGSRNASQYSDQVDGVLFPDRDGKMGSSSSSPGKRASRRPGGVPDGGPGPAPASGSPLADGRHRKVVPGLKVRPRGGEDAESKNLFLKKLNSEMLSEREREPVANPAAKHYDKRVRSNGDDMDKLAVSHFSPGQVPKPGVKPGSNQSGYYDDMDGPNGRSVRPVVVDVDAAADKSPFQVRPNSNFQGRHPGRGKPVDDYRYYATTPGPRPTVYACPTPPTRVISYQSVAGESPMNSRWDDSEPGQQKMSNRKVQPLGPSKSYTGQESEIHGKPGVYRRNTDVYRVGPGNEFDYGDKKMTVAVKTVPVPVEKNNKAFDCIPWSHSTSSRSSGEASSSDQHSNKSDSSRFVGHHYPDPDTPSKSDVKMMKKVEQVKASDRKVRPNEVQGLLPGCEPGSNGPGKQARPEDRKPNSGVEFCNYGIAATSKLRQNSSKYSKDDFVLDEPTAPPRVKRHASVTIPRNSVNSSEHMSAWTSPDTKVCTDRNPTTEADQNAWSGSFGVDLDAVAASMQQNKGESSVLKSRVWSGGKNHGTPSNSSSNSKKKQHYF